MCRYQEVMAEAKKRAWAEEVGVMVLPSVVAERGERADAMVLSTLLCEREM